jgi:signal transduction histidine kinase
LYVEIKLKSFFTYFDRLYRFFINQGVDKDISLREASRVRLSNGLALFLILNIIVGVQLGSYWDATSLMVMYGAGVLHLLSIFVLNRNRYYKLARLTIISTANLIATYFSYREKGVDIHLFLIPISYLAFILFARRDKHYIALAFAFSAILLLSKLYLPEDFFSKSTTSISQNLEFSKKFVHIEVFIVCIFFVFYMFWESKKTASLLAQEVTRKEKAEAELDRYYHANLYLSQSEAIRSGDLDLALREIAKISGQAMQVRRVNIWKYDSEKRQIECLCHYDQEGSTNLVGHCIKEEDVPHYFQYIIKENLITAPQAQTDEISKELRDNYLIPNSIFSLLDIPIKIEGKMQGLVCFEATQHARLWSINEKEFGLNIASTIALAMEAFNRKQINQKLQESLEDQQAVLGIVAHDLKNPMSGAISACDILKTMTEDIKDEYLKTELQSYLELIAQSQRHGLYIINELLETVNLENTKELFDLEKIELSTVILPIINLLEGNAHKKKIKITHNFFQEDLFVLMNVSQLVRVIENLISNAIKYTYPNGEIEVKLSKGTDYQLISVKDNGIGIPQDLLPIIFDKFTKAKRKGTQNEASTGLGMFISKQIVKAHQGEIWVESREGEGSIFYVKLPILVD